LPCSSSEFLPTLAAIPSKNKSTPPICKLILKYMVE
jgi:hypothetical protein